MPLSICGSAITITRGLFLQKWSPHICQMLDDNEKTLASDFWASFAQTITLLLQRFLSFFNLFPIYTIEWKYIQTLCIFILWEELKYYIIQQGSFFFFFFFSFIGFLHHFAESIPLSPIRYRPILYCPRSVHSILLKSFLPLEDLEKVEDKETGKKEKCGNRHSFNSLW